MIVKIVIIGIISAVLAVMIKRDAPVYATVLALCASVLILIMLLPGISAILSLVDGITKASSFEIPYVESVLKVIGVAYICEFGSQMCVDAGETAIASKIDIAGKVVIMGIAAPIVMTLINQIAHLGF